MTLREDVLNHLWENNLPTFPLRDKRPLVDGWKGINEFVPEDTPFGVNLGGDSKIIVIDVDDITLQSYFAEIIKKTYSVKTGRGFHIYIRVNKLPPSNRQLHNTKGQGVDIKTTGGYVVGETSEHYEKDHNGNYVKSGKVYELLSKDRTINFVDFETEIKPILGKLGFELKKESITDREAKAIKEGIPKGNRNNGLFAIACHTLKSVKDLELAYNHIASINEKFPEPLPKEEIDQLFQSATETVQKNIEEKNSNFDNGKTKHRILSEPPEELRAITLTKNGTRMILVYLPTEIEHENNEITFGSKGYIVYNGVEGKDILDLELSKELREKFQCDLLSDFPILSRKWKYADIQTYLDSESVNPVHVFDNLMKLERKYFDNEFDFDYYFQVCWIAHTYFYTLFEYTPYNDFTGIKGVGKSKRLTFLSMLSYNGILSGDSTISVIFRTVMGTGASLFLDETEQLTGGKDSKVDLENLLRNGFQRNGQVARSGDKSKNFNPEFFSVYSPKGLGHIEGLENTLEDRAITTNQLRTRNKDIAKTFPNELRDPLIYISRKGLYELWLDYGHIVPKLTSESQELLSEILSGRELELWLPIMTMALFFERHGKEGITDKILTKVRMNTEGRKISDLEGNIHFQVLQIIEKNLNQIPKQSSKLYELINAELALEYHLEQLSDKKLKGILDRLGFHQKRISGYQEWININQENVKRAKESLGLIEHTQDTLSDIDSTNKNDSSVGSVGSAR